MKMMKMSLLAMLLFGGAMSATGAVITVPWDQARGEYYLDMPMTTAYSPDSKTGTFNNQNGDKWITGNSSTGSGTWIFALEGGALAKQVTVAITVYDRGQYSWSGSHTTSFGISATEINQTVGSCYWNSVPSTGGFFDYGNTFSNLSCAEFYITHLLANGWTNLVTAQQLRVVTITAAIPEPAALGMLVLGILALARRRRG